MAATSVIAYELESKFRVDDRQIFADLLALTTIDDFSLTPRAGIERQQNSYFDTPDHRLAAQRATLRVRELAQQRIGTFKQGLQHNLHRQLRAEWEVVIGPHDHPAFWPPGPARNEALRALGDSPLLCLFRVQTRRRYIDVMQAGRLVVELSLDEGVISAGGRVVGFRELELELCTAGTQNDLDALEQLLHARFSLTPEPRGKKSRGFALLQSALASGQAGRGCDLTVTPFEARPFTHARL